MDQTRKVYRCGQCSRLDERPGTVVVVVSHDIDYQMINMYPAPKVTSYVTNEREVMLCDDCMREIYPQYGAKRDI